MTYNISIHKSCGSFTGLDTYSSRHIQLENQAELDHLHALCRNRKNMAGFWKASFIPIRTDRDFIGHDLFLPTLINGVIKTESATNTAMIVVAAFWDIATLPARLFTFIPRLFYNQYIATSSNHPLMTYFACKGVNPRNYEGDVHVLVYKEEHRRNRIYENGMRYKLHLSDQETPGIGSSTLYYGSSRPE